MRNGVANPTDTGPSGRGLRVKLRRNHADSVDTDAQPWDLVLNWIDRQPIALFLIAALTLGLAPFVPEPHVWEKLKMLATGELTRPLDIFDLLLHAAPWALLALKLQRHRAQSGSAG